MKKLFIPVFAIGASLLFLAGCAGPSVKLGGGSKTTTVVQKPTIGQQLVDLQKAKETGAITDAEFQAQKAKVLENK
jgi:hypothetical protein